MVLVSVPKLAKTPRIEKSDADKQIRAVNAKLYRCFIGGTSDFKWGRIINK